MSKITVNAMGEACPIPVVKATRALREMKEPGILEILVDNEIAVQNLTRMADGHHLASAAEKTGENAYIVTMQVDQIAVADTVASEDIACVADARGDLVVAVGTDSMGQGSDELGRALLKAFLFAVGQLPELPKTMLFYNGGVKMTTEGSPALEDLKNLEAQGVEILSCGTCLNYYGLTEKLSVGGVTNMYTIVEKQTAAAKVLRP